MHQPTDLASGQINNSDCLTVELIEPPDAPAFVAISWPAAATIATVATYDQVAATAMRILAGASTALAGIKVRRKL